MSARLAALAWCWLGAAVLFTAVVAPAAFAVLPTRALAGLLVGQVLPVLFWTGAALGVVMLFASAGWLRAAAGLLLAASLAAQLLIAPRIRELRSALGPDLETVSPADPRRVAFGRLHGVSVALLGVGMLGAAALAFVGTFRRRATVPSVATPSGNS